jgi:hypothetical protein
MLYRGYNESFIIIKNNISKTFLQFRKIVDKNNDVFIELVFPKAKWSEKYYNKLHETLMKNNIEYSILPKEDAKSLEFTIINCEKDLDVCMNLISIIYQYIFEIKETNLLFDIKFLNVSPNDEKIGNI